MPCFLATVHIYILWAVDGDSLINSSLEMKVHPVLFARLVLSNLKEEVDASVDLEQPFSPK